MRLAGLHPWAMAAMLSPLAGAAADDGGAWRALREPGTVALMRHAEAPGTFDPPEMRLDDCASQRNLSDRGRAQAQAVGRQFKAQGIAFARVLTSQWCRCRDTASLLDLEPVAEHTALNSLHADQADRDSQTARLRELAASGDKLMLVSHQSTITALTGESLASGEVLVVQQSGGETRVRGRIPPP